MASSSRSEIRKELDEIEKSLKRIRRMLEGPAPHARIKGEQIAPYIQAWIDEGYTLIVLSLKSGVSERILRRILAGGNVRETTADKIMTALNLTHIELDIIPPGPPPSQYYEE